MMKPYETAKSMLRYHKTKEKAIKAVEKRLEKACKLPYGMKYLWEIDFLNEVIEEINAL